MTNSNQNNENFPKILYKYLPLRTIDELNYRLDMLENSRLYMPYYKQLNDKQQEGEFFKLNFDNNPYDIIKQFEVLEDSIIITNITKENLQKTKIDTSLYYKNFDGNCDYIPDLEYCDYIKDITYLIKKELKDIAHKFFGSPESETFLKKGKFNILYKRKNKTNECELCMEIYPGIIKCKDLKMNYTEIEEILEKPINNILNIPYRDYITRKYDIKKTCDMKNMCRILSLCENNSSQPMWAYYGGNHEGICIGFKTNGIFSKAKRIKYTKEILKSKNIDLNDDKFLNNITNELCNSFFYKNEGWKHENEYRIVDFYNNFEEKKYFEFKPEDIACIIFGNELDAKYRSSICHILYENSLKIDLFEDDGTNNLKKINYERKENPIIFIGGTNLTFSKEEGIKKEKTPEYTETQIEYKITYENSNNKNITLAKTNI